MAAMKTAESKLGGLLRNFEQDAGAQTDDARLRLEQQWVTAHIIAARAIDAIERMRELSPVALPERIMGQHTLTPAEAERWLVDARMIENAECIEDATLTDSSEKRGRGRPRKDAPKA